MDIFDLSAKITLDSSEFEKGVKEAGGGMDGLSAKAVALGNAIYDIGKAAVSAFGTLAKSALEGYANFEQLTGGISTLYEDLSYDISLFAQDAYKTAGLSANEYMETAMSFAATLNQSLTRVDGNIARSADLTNLAITDMADNANKMGTSMTMIQNAYQGFAKQNYTMLDNLKLGYGGTQQEMYRLLEDAANLNEEFAKTANFSIDGKGHLEAEFSDIVEAIHIVQTEMGITGTTSLEAASTISGSVASMKAAWENWLVGLGDEGADLSGLTDNLITSLETVIGNVMPVMSRIKDSLAEVFVDVFADITGIDLTPVLDKFNSLKDGISETISSLVTAFQEGKISGVIDELVQKFEDLTGLDLSGVQTFFDGLSTTFSDLSTAFQEGKISGVIDELVQKFEDLTGIDLSGLVEGISGFFNSFDAVDKEKISGIVENVGAIIDSLNFPSLGETITAIAEGLGKVFEVLGGAIDLGLDVIAGIISQLRQDFDVWAPGIAAVSAAIAVFVVGLGALKIIDSIKNSVSLFSGVFSKLNAVMTANPILLVVSLLAGLAAAFITAYQTNDEFRAKVNEAWEKIKESAKKLLETFKQVFTKDIPAAVSSGVAAVKAKVSEFIQAGKDLIGGFINGIKEKLGAVKDAVGEAAETAVGWIKDKLGINSPSKVFAEIGRYSMAGLAIGFEDGYGKYSKRINDSIESLIPSNMTASVDFASSAIGKSSAASVNAVMASSQESIGTQTINLVVDGRTLANVIFDPLSGVAKQKGVAIGA